mgnify:CR=1 FL=1
MVFSGSPRSQRSDRLRRIARESAISDSGYADKNYSEKAASDKYQKSPSEGSKRNNKNRSRNTPLDPELLLEKDSPSYSQSVRKPCQQRLVQWIPIRKSSLASFVATCWMAWALLLAGHYLLHTRANSIGRSPVPIAQLLDLRSPHSIANWMTCQLWLLTALAAWLVYSIRQHRLDDFKATYRIWLVMVGLSIFSCFEIGRAHV